MSVFETVILPAQPATGQVKLMPLGGRGMVSPSQLLRIRANLASDASGGTNTLRFDLDPVFDQIVANVMIRVDGAAADVLADITINEDRRPVQDHFIATSVTLPFSAAGGFAQGLFTPPPILLEDVSRLADGTSSALLGIAIPNTNGETLQVTSDILLFNKRAFEYVPIELLVGALGRSTDFT